MRAGIAITGIGASCMSGEGILALAMIESDPFAGIGLLVLVPPMYRRGNKEVQQQEECREEMPVFGYNAQSVYFNNVANIGIGWQTEAEWE